MTATSRLILVVGAACALGLVLGVGAHRGFWSEITAAWVQAVGTAGAIAAAVLLQFEERAHSRAMQEREWEAARARQEAEWRVMRELQASEWAAARELQHEIATAAQQQAYSRTQQHVLKASDVVVGFLDSAIIDTRSKINYIATIGTYGTQAARRVELLTALDYTLLHPNAFRPVMILIASLELLQAYIAEGKYKECDRDRIIRTLRLFRRNAAKGRTLLHEAYGVEAKWNVKV